MTTRIQLLAVLALAAPALAQPSITVIPASAPNAFGSPSYNGWVSNALVAIENGYATYGTAGTPTYYSQAPATMDVRENFVTSFPSWLGDPNPGTTYGAAFASELGNRLSFGLHILGNGTQFSISQLGFVGASGDSGNTLGFTFATGTYNYSTQYVGIDYVDGIKGNGNDVVITGGANTQLIDELIGRGSGNAWWPQVPGDGATPQEAIDNVAAALSLETPFLFTGTYTLTLGSGPIQAAGSVEFVPAPGSLALLGLSALAAGRRRR